MKVIPNHHSNPLLNHLHFHGDDFSCKIFPNLGASLQEFRCNGREIIKGISTDAAGIAEYSKMMHSAFLFPFPNRLENGTYEHEGKTHQFPINETEHNNAIHGFLFEKEFEVLNQSENEVTLTYASKGEEGFPFSFKVLITYTFSSARFSIDFSVQNLGTTSFPFGMGWHPYFLLNNPEASTIHFSPKREFIANKRKLPESEKSVYFKEISAHQQPLDSTFEIETETVQLKQSSHILNISATPSKYVQLYIPENGNTVAIEPMTCIGNAFNNKKGLKILSPNETFEWKISVAIKTV